MDYDKTVRDFMARHGLYLVISVSGAFLDSDAVRAETTVNELFGSIKDRSSGIAILTGGTKWNLPGLATKLAKEYGFKVIGVFPEKAKNQKAEGLDLEIPVHPSLGQSEFGDETPLFVKISDAIITLGGGPGAAAEIFMSLKMSSAEAPVHLVPIFGFGGVTDLFLDSQFSTWYNKPRICTGKEAADALRVNLMLT